VLRGNLEKTKRTRLEGQLDRQQTFLRLFGELGRIGDAARGVGMNRQAHYDWLREDAQGYRGKWELAQAEWREGLESRAMARIDDPQGNRGSDVLLLAMLNAAWPDKYRPGVVVVDDTAKELIARLRRGPKASMKAAMDVDKELSEG
jgi:hypothetical protein